MTGIEGNSGSGQGQNNGIGKTSKGNIEQWCSREERLGIGRVKETPELAMEVLDCHSAMEMTFEFSSKYHKAEDLQNTVS